MKQFLSLLVLISFLMISCKKDEDTKIRTIHVPDEVSSIQEAINEAHDFDTILVSHGKYEENITFNGKKVYLASLYYKTRDTMDIKNTIISGYQNSVLRFENNEDTTSIIDGFYITNGGPHSNGGNLPNHLQGGGIYIHNSKPLLRNLLISGNKMYFPNNQGDGGGIYCENGYLIASNVIIAGNFCGGYGGGGIYAKNSYINMQNCQIKNNGTGLIPFCGGIYFEGSNFSIQNSIIENNGNPLMGKILDNLIVNCTGEFINTIINDSTLVQGGNVKFLQYHK